jgi:hypothetical protein
MPQGTNGQWETRGGDVNQSPKPSVKHPKPGGKQ